MKPYCKLIACLIIILITSSCATSWQSTCGQNATLAITTVGDKHPTRVILGYTIETGEYHAQAQVFIDGQWQWLSVYNWQRVRIGRAEFQLREIRVLSGKKYMDRQKKRLK